MNTMKKWMVFLVVFVVLGLIASNIFWWQAQQSEVDKVTRIETELRDVQVELEQWKDAAYYYKQMMFQRGDELQESAVKLAHSQAELYNTQHELEVVKAELETIQAEFETAKTEEFQKGKESGYNLGYEEGKKEVSESGILLRKPTRQELIDRWFLIPDAKVIKSYIPGKIVCIDIAAAFNNAAVEDEFQVGVAILVYNYPNGGKWGHFINVFKTQEGIIYIEPQNHKEVKVEIGKSYSKLNGFDPEPDDIIREIIIFW